MITLNRVAVITQYDVVSHHYDSPLTCLPNQEAPQMWLQPGDLVVLEASPFRSGVLWCEYEPGKFGLLSPNEFEVLGEL